MPWLLRPWSRRTTCLLDSGQSGDNDRFAWSCAIDRREGHHLAFRVVPECVAEQFTRCFAQSDDFDVTETAVRIMAGR